MSERAFTLAGFPFRDALDHTGLGVIATDETGAISMVSPALRILFGGEAAAAERHPDYAGAADLFAIVREDGTPMPAEEVPLARASAGEFVKDVVIGVLTADTTVWLRCNGAPMRGPDGEHVGAWVLTHDITAQRRAEAVQDELRARLVHTVDHEFRTPLAAMLGNLELVHDHHQVDEDLSRSLAAIERAAWRLCHLVGTAATLIERQEELYREGRTPDGAPRRMV